MQVRQLVHKVCLTASLEQLGLGDEISIPLAMFKETTVRVSVHKLAHRTGCKYKVTCGDDDCIVRRIC